MISLPHPRDCSLRQGVKRARSIRRCGNGHPILPGDRVVYWVGIIDGEWAPWEECVVCVEHGWGMPWLARYWTEVPA